jgi:WhiB family redox-sensing transcriptional regulator
MSVRKASFGTPAPPSQETERAPEASPIDDAVELVPVDEYEWMMHARCRGAKPTAFFPSDGLGVESAQHVCHECEVRVECLEYALLHRIEHGVWGGASERERRRILRRRRDEEAMPQ